MRRFEFKQGASSKFWEVSLAGQTVTVRFGRIGTNGQTQTKKHSTVTAAAAEQEKLVREKVKKGYVELMATALPPLGHQASATPPAPRPPADPAFTADEQRLLVEDLERLAPYGKDLPSRVLRYVIDGDDARVLDVLTQLTQGPKGFEIRGRFHAKEGPRAVFFETLQTRAVGPLLRLGRVYDAAGRIGVPLIPFGRWLTAFLAEARQFTLGVYPPKSQPCPALDASLIEQMLTLDGQNPDILVRGAFFCEIRHWTESPGLLFAEVPGFPDAVQRYPQVALEALSDSAKERRLHALKILDGHGGDPTPFANRLATLVVGPNRKLREAAEVVLRKLGSTALPLLQGWAGSRDADERIRATSALARIGGAEARAFLETRLQADPTKVVREHVETLLSQFAPDSPSLAVPPTPPLPASAPLGADVLDAFRRCAESLNQVHDETRRRFPRAPVAPAFLSEQIDAVFPRLEDLAPGERLFVPPLCVWYRGGHIVRKIVQRFLEHPSLLPVHMVRALILFGYISPGGEYDLEYGFPQEVEPLLGHYRRHHSPPLTLAALGQTFLELGLDDRRIGRYYLRRLRYYGSAFPWGRDAIWPYFAERLDLLAAALQLGGGHGNSERARAFEILALFPAPPALLQPPLWDAALGPSKQERARAQACLERDPQRTAKTIKALQSKKAEVRHIAAEWLGRQGDRAAVPVLIQALATEKQDGVRAALLSSLETLGGAIESYVGRDVLAKEAQQGLAAKVKSRLALRWLPLADRPTVHWESDGRAVSAEILEWLLVQSHTLGSPEPGPLLRRYTAAFRADERRAFGAFVLDRWIRWDVRDSAITDRGVLAVVAACCDRTVVPAVGNYVREHYGQRMAQCKALLQMLSWIDDASVIQYLLSIATRFRTKGIQAEAKRLTEAIAEEKGWSVDELADRAIPTAGLAQDGTLALDYGARRFTARLEGESLTLSEDGQGIAALPAVRKGDDRVRAAEARALLEEARRELKSTLMLQKHRLYEALCTQRTWTFADWDVLLRQHPIVGGYCRRLAWAVDRAGGATIFRPLEDGSLTDHEDRRMQIEASERVRVAHASLVNPALAAAWVRHFLDYEITPLFDQFGRAPYVLAESAREETEILDFEGHLLKSFTLGQKAQALGYERGPYIHHLEYELCRKRFHGLGLEAVLHFTPALASENNDVYLRRLSFSSQDPQRKSEQPGESMLLGDVPPVLLSECWNDIRQIAAAGGGHVPEWREKTGIRW